MSYHSAFHDEHRAPSRGPPRLPSKEIIAQAEPYEILSLDILKIPGGPQVRSSGEDRNTSDISHVFSWSLQLYFSGIKIHTKGFLCQPVLLLDLTHGMDEDDQQQDFRPNDWDVDSAIADLDYDDFASTMSLTSSVLAYREENGRRYHAFRDGQYFMPNDELEQQGMDLMHQLSKMTLHDHPFRAPISSPGAILEIGTGTGIWAIEVADLFPGANFIATDLSPIQPSWVPPNLEFQVDDCESPWDFGIKFDFIHMRNLSGSIADWPELLQRCYDQLNPGGWLEVSNIEAWGQSNNKSLTMESASYHWQSNLKNAAAAVGRELNIAPEMAKLQKQAGFVDVLDDKYMWPMSPWLHGKRKFSKMFNALVDLELEAMSLRLYTQVLGWSADDVYTLLAGVRHEIDDVAYELYADMHYICGRKPEDA